MLGEPPETLVLPGSEPAGTGDAGTSAVLAGLMSMLSEVLDNLDVRLGALEDRVEAVLSSHRREREEELAAIEGGVEAVVHRAFAPVLGRLERVEAALGPRPAGGAAGLDALRDTFDRRLDGIEDTVARTAAEAAAGATAAAERAVAGLLSRLGSLEAAVGERSSAVVDALTGEVRAALGRATTQLEERLRSLDPTERVVAELSSALRTELPRVADAVRAIGQGEGEGAASAARTTARSLARLEAGLAELRAESGLALQSLAGRLDELEEDVRGLRDLAGTPPSWVGAPPPAPALEDLEPQFARLESAVAAVDEGVAARHVQLSADVHAALAAATDRLLLHTARAGEAVAGDVRASLAALRQLGAAVDALGADVGGIAAGVDRMTADERQRPLLDALEVLGREQREALHLTQATVSRRVDAGVATVVRVVDDLAAPLAGVGDVVQQVGGALAEHARRVEELRAAVDAIAEWTGRLPTATALREGLESLRDGLAGAGAGEAYEQLRREVGESLAILERRHAAATAEMLERVGGWLDEQHHRLEAVQAACQSLTSASEQSASAGGRVAELMLETRSALRADVERLESTVHLESVKQQQQGWARLAQVAAGVTDVVERENAVLVQRVTALAAAVDAVRTALLVHAEETGHAAARGRPEQ